MTQFNPLSVVLDKSWLDEHGWTAEGYVAYRHLLHDYHRDNEVPSLYQIASVLSKYSVSHQQAVRIKEAIREDRKKTEQEIFDTWARKQGLN